MSNWSNIAKRVLKAEMLKKGISSSDLAKLLKETGIDETKSSIDSKISRGTFSAAFLLQCLFAIGCSKIEIDDYISPLFKIVAEPTLEYKKQNHE